MSQPTPPVIVETGDDDLSQTDTHPGRYPAIPVTVEGITRVRSLPARRLTLNNVIVPAGGVERIVGRQDQRQSLTLFAVDEPVYLFTERPANEDSTAGFPLPAGAQLSLDYNGEIFAGNTGSDPATIGYAFTTVEE